MMTKYYLVLLISACSLHYIFAASVKSDADAVKYPGPANDEDVPDECKDKNYCTIKPKDYPEDEFNNIFKGFKSNPLNFRPNPVVSLHNRQGDPLSTDDCDAVVTFEPLYRVRVNRSSSWRTVVQAPKEDFIQKIRLETCVKQAQATGKLDSCMRGPYRVVKILPHGRYQLQLLAGSYGKSTQAAAEYMVPWHGEWTPEVCAAYFNDADADEEGPTSAAPMPGPSLSQETMTGPAEQPNGASSAPVSESRAAPVAPQEELEPGLSMPPLEVDLQS